MTVGKISAQLFSSPEIFLHFEKMSIENQISRLASNKRNVKVRILMVVDNMRFPISDGSSERYLVWLRTLKELGFKTYLLNFTNSKKSFDVGDHLLASEYAEDVLDISLHYGIFMRFTIKITDTVLRFIGVSSNIKPFSAILISKQRRRSFRDYIVKKNISCIIVNKVSSAIHFGLGNLEKYNGLKIIDIHDIHSNHYLLKKKALNKIPWKAFFKEKYSKFLYEKILNTFVKQNYKREMEEEIGIFSKFDKILLTSTEEKEILDGVSGVAGKVVYLPPCVSSVENRNGDHNKKEYDLGFIGSSGLFNIDAIDYFLDSIYPLILDKKPDVSFLMGGSICNAFRETALKSKISFLNNFENMYDFYKQITLAIVPLRFGTGVSVKILEAMSYGCPAVSTFAGARGLDIENGRDLHIVDKPDFFAGAIVSLLKNDNALKIIKRNALRTIRLKYSVSCHQAMVESILTSGI